MRLFLITFLVPILVTSSYHRTDVGLGTHRHHLPNVELKLSTTLDHRLQERITFLHRFTSRFSKLTSTRSALFKEDLNTPLQALSIVRRLAEEWTVLAGMLVGNYGLSELGIDTERWPTLSHVSLAAYQVMRTQWTYGYDTRHLVDGIVSGSRVISNVTAADCFHVGRTYWEYSHVDEAMDWYEQAVYKVSRGDTSVPLQTLAQHLMPYLCYSGRKMNKRMKVVTLLKQTFGRKLQVQSDFAWSECLSINEKVYHSAKQGLLGEMMGDEQLELHRRVCGQGPTESLVLRCRYLHYDLPQLKLQPFKVEELHRDPPVLRFHEVVTDQEADQLTTFGTKFKDYQEDGRNGTGYRDNYRTTLGTWVNRGELEVNDRLSRRMEDITQLSLALAEDSKLTRYSTGGEYLTHHDYILNDDEVTFDLNRIAVLMFYLTSVKEGGYTIFPNINLTVKPIKNSAILWYNVLPSGEQDMRTEHSGCPVVWGTKWVLVKHITNGGNEFKKPCGLRESDSFTPYYFQG